MTEELLERIYYDVEGPASYSGVEKLYKEAKRINANISRKEVADWLSGELVYSLHKPVRKNFKRNPIIAEKPNENFQADLVDMKEFSKINDGVTYILTVIDVFSKKAWAVPLKTKNSINVSKAMGKIFDQITPNKLQTDRGTEFTNEVFKLLVEKHNVIHFTSKNSDIKCSIIERFNRTLKNKMFKYFTKIGSRRFVDVLDNLVNSYNKTFHRTIKMSPNEVCEKNEKEVFENIYGFKSKRHMLKKLRKPILNIGDKVRKKYDIKTLERGYYPNWTDQIFTINKSIRNIKKPLYEIKTPKGEGLNRRFYSEEIQKIKHKTSDIFRIEKILNQKTVKGKKLFFIKWLNHPESENSWEPAENIFNIKNGEERK